MPTSVVSYDKDLPEIPHRRADERPDSYLRKKPASADEFEIVEGRRPSTLLLVEGLRPAVDRWREDDYAAAGPVSRRLLTYWFEEDHLVNGELFRYYFGQRESVETLIYLIEVRRLFDATELIRAFASPHAGTLLPDDVEFLTTMDGRRKVRRPFTDQDPPRIGEQDLPPEGLRRYGFKMATGSGKTVVMAMLMVWSYFHKRMTPGSDLSTNFLVLAPNVIVYERLEKDFGGNRIFHTLPLIPPEWSWNVKPVMRGENVELDSSGNLIVTNVQQLYERSDDDWTPANAVEALLGRKPVKDLAAYGESLLDRIKALPDLVVINDEAHHVHDEDLAWNKTLMTVHEALPRGLSLWLDFSATPKDQSGTYYPWLIVDYPLAQAVEDRIVKAPLIVHRIGGADPTEVTEENVGEKYGPWLLAALDRWRVHFETYAPFGIKPVLFIMAETNKLADAIGKWLESAPEAGLKRSEILVIHTDKSGDIRKGDLEALRTQARDIDQPRSKIKVIVSVMMLREGWDVRNVSVVLGLRPFTAKAEILPEQAVGRGLRLMQGIGPDRTQTLEVMGTNAFEDFVRRLETEGVGIRTTTTPPPPPVIVAPVQEKLAYDIAIPITKPVLQHVYRNIRDLAPLALQPLWDTGELPEIESLNLMMEFATTGTEVHQAVISPGEPPIANELLRRITKDVERRTGLDDSHFFEIFPAVKTYVARRCFGGSVEVDSTDIRERLRPLDMREAIAKYLAREINALTVQRKPVSSPISPSRSLRQIRSPGAAST